MASNQDTELNELLDKFVRVRLVQMGGVDLNIYQFDPLLSWALFFMNGDKTIYGRYGTASPNTKRNRKDSNPSHSSEGLGAALRRARRASERAATGGERKTLLTVQWHTARQRSHDPSP